MKIKSLLVVTALTLALLPGPLPAFADDASAVTSGASKSEKAKGDAKTPPFSGTISAVSPKERTLTVKKGLVTKKFNLADNCNFVVEDKHDARLADLRPGHRVEVSYQNDSGVLVAHRVAQENLSFDGAITAIDKDKNTVTGGNYWSKKTFKITPDSRLSFHDKPQGSLDDLKLGHKVHLTYELDRGNLKVVRLEQHSLNFDGVVKAVDTTDRTLKAKVLLSEKKFELASDCAIVVDGHIGSRMSDLKLGRQIDIDYEEVDGIYVAHRVSQTSTPEIGVTAATGSEPK